MLAKIGLLSETAYQIEEPIVETDHLFKYYRFLEDHLFYLINPVPSSGDLFVTVKSESDPESKHIQVIRSPDSVPADWFTQFTCLPRDDFFTILACMNLPWNNTVFHILTQNYLNTVSSSGSQALKLPGNPLEVSTAITIVVSSQSFHRTGWPCTLSGIDGYDFICNLIANSCKANRKLWLPISLVFAEKCGPLSRWFYSLRFPFLYSIDRPDACFGKLAL